MFYLKHPGEDLQRQSRLPSAPLQTTDAVPSPLRLVFQLCRVSAQQNPQNLLWRIRSMFTPSIAPWWARDHDKVWLGQTLGAVQPGEEKASG